MVQTVKEKRMALTVKKVYAILKRQISDMEAKLNIPVRYRGTVASADLLPLNPDIGDMYNIESKSIYGEAGMNVAWNGVVWDTMGAPIDMSLYFTKEEAEAVIQRLVTEYFEKNPVKPGATTEQAQQIEQNKTDITSLKTETSSLNEEVYGSEKEESVINVDWEIGGITDETGLDNTSTNLYRTDFIEYNPPMRLIMDEWSSEHAMYRVFFYDENKQYLAREKYITAPYLTRFEDAPSGTKYIRFKTYTNSTFTMRLAYGTTGSVGLLEKVDIIHPNSKRTLSVIAGTTKRKPMLTIIDDDGHKQFREIYTQFLEKGIPITCAIDPVNWIEGNAKFMTWEDVHVLKKLGCEFVVHGNVRWNWPDLSGGYATEQDFRNYVEAAQLAFKEHGLTAYDIGVYPQGHNNIETRNVMHEYFRACIITGPNGAELYSVPPVKTYRLPRYVFVHDTNENGHSTLAESKKQIDNIVQDNGWLILCGHSYYAGFNDECIQNLLAMCDYAKEKGVQIVSASDGLDAFGNLMEIGDYDSDESSNCWVVGCDGTEIRNFGRRKIAMFGDSITWGSVKGVQTQYNIPYWVSKETGNIVSNFGVSSQGWICPVNSKTGVDTIRSTDLTGYDVATLMYGINDSNYKLGTYLDTEESTTIMGSLYTAVKVIMDKYPNMTLILISPPNTCNKGVAPKWRLSATLEGGYTGQQLIDEYKKFADYYNIPFISFNNCPINSFNIENLLSDTLHPTEQGYKILGTYLAAQITQYIRGNK